MSSFRAIDRLQDASDLTGIPGVGKGWVQAGDGSMVWTDLATQAELDAAVAAVSPGYSLASGAAVGATTVTLAQTPKVKTGDFVAISSGLVNCEIRRVTGVAGSVVTVATAFKYSHTLGDVVERVNDAATWEMYGAISSASTDSYPSLRNALLDQSIHGLPLFGPGPNAGPGYGTSRPIWINDSAVFRYTRITPKNWALNNLSGGWQDGRPCQYLATFDGNGGSTALATFDHTTGTFAKTAGIGLDQEIQFYPWGDGATLPTGIEEGRKYWVVSDSAGRCKVALTRADYANPVTFSTDGSGSIRVVSCGQGKMLLDWCWFAGGSVQGLSGLMISTAQPQMSSHVRVDYFPVVGVTWEAVQGYLEEWQITRCWGGVEKSESVAGTIHGCDIESCDFPVVLGANNSADKVTAGPCLANNFSGVTHMEGTAIGTCRIKTLYAVGTLTGGTFTITFRGVTTTHNWNVTPAQLLADLIANNHYIASGDLDIYGGIDYVDSVAATLTSTGKPGTKTRTAITLNNQPFIFDFEQPTGAYRWSQMKPGENVWPKDPSGFGDGDLVLNSTNLVGGTVAEELVRPDSAAFTVAQAESSVVEHTYSAGAIWLSAVNAWLRYVPIVRFVGNAVDPDVGSRNEFALDYAYNSDGRGFAIAYDSLQEPGSHLVLSNNGATTSGTPTRSCSFSGYKRMGVYNTDVSQQHSLHMHWSGYKGRAFEVSVGTLDAFFRQRAANGEASALFQWEDWAGNVLSRLSKAGYFMTMKSSAPAAGDLATGEVALWWDTTTGAPTLRATGKDAAGTLFTLTMGNSIPKSVGSAKGSLIGFSAAGVPAEIPVGSNGQVLIADSTQAAGARYASPQALTLPAPIELVFYSGSPNTGVVPAAITVWPNANGGRRAMARADLTNMTDCRLIHTMDSASSQYEPAITAVDTTLDTLTVTAHGLTENQPIGIGGSTVPGGVTVNATYFAHVVDANTFKLMTTPSAGVYVDITSAGTSPTLIPTSLAIQYSTNLGSTWFWFDGASGAAGFPACAVAALSAASKQAVATGPWIVPASAAKADQWLRVVSVAGNAVTNPSLSNVKLQVR